MTLRDFLPSFYAPARSEASDRAPSTARGWRTPLAMKFAAALIGLVVLVLLVNGVINTWLAYDQIRRAALMVEEEKASSAAVRVGEFLTEIVNQLGWTTGAEWRHAQSAQQRYDFVRLLRQVPGDHGTFLSRRPGPRADQGVPNSGPTRSAATRTSRKSLLF